MTLYKSADTPHRNEMALVLRPLGGVAELHHRLAFLVGHNNLFAIMMTKITIAADQRSTFLHPTRTLQLLNIKESK